MGPLATALLEQLRFTHFVMAKVTSDMKNEDAIARARNGEGASISWVVGHLCYYRYNVINLLGGNMPNPFESFAGDADDGSGYPDISELLASWNEIHGEVEAILEGVDDAQLLAPMPGKDGPHSEKRVFDTMVFFAWHEAYHMGTVGMMRLDLGYKATAERAMEG